MRPRRRTVSSRMADDRPIQPAFQQHVEDLRLVIRPDRKRHVAIRPHRHRRPVIPARFHAGRFPGLFQRLIHFLLRDPQREYALGLSPL